MKIVFIRHGKPDYKTDSLLPLGRIQAEAVAQRVKSCGISELYASTMGRAYQTAEPISRELGLDIIGCDFMREITWGSEDGKELEVDGNPWHLMDALIKRGENIAVSDWRMREPFVDNTKLFRTIDRVIAGADEWLASLGFVREGRLYRVTEAAQNKTVAMVSHGGSSTALLSHMLNIPFPQFCAFFRPYFTSLTVVEIGGAVGDLCSVKLLTIGERYHVPTDTDAGEIKQ